MDTLYDLKAELAEATTEDDVDAGVVVSEESQEQLEREMDEKRALAETLRRAFEAQVPPTERAEVRATVTATVEQLMQQARLMQEVAESYGRDVQARVADEAEHVRRFEAAPPANLVADRRVSQVMMAVTSMHAALLVGFASVIEAVKR